MKSKQQKREEGRERDMRWQSLTADAKLAILAGRPGQSKRQVRKLREEQKKS